MSAIRPLVKDPGWVIACSAMGLGAAALALSQMQALWHLLLFFAIGRALAVGALEPAAFVAVSNWFIRRRALVAGIVAVGPRLGMGLLPLLVAVVIAYTGSWRAGWVALAAIAFAAGVPALLFVRRRPEDIGLRPDGDHGSGDDWARLPLAPGPDFELREAIRTRAYWLVGLTLACVMSAGGAINFHQIPYLIDQGLSRTEAALVVTVFSGIGALGALIGGSIATRVTMRWTMVPSLLGMAVGVLLLLNATSISTAMLYAVFYGFFFGAEVSLGQVIHADYFGRRSMGAIRGSFQPLALAVNAAGPVAAGLWYDRTGSYTGPFILFSFLFALAALSLAFAAYPRKPQR